MSKSEVTARLAGTSAVLLAGAAGFAQAQDVAGFYAGIGLAMPSGDIKLPFGGSYSIDSGGLGSVFAGYNMVSGGGLVYGGEIALTQGGTMNAGGYYGPGGEMSNLIDVKARLGKVFGTTLVYGSLGYSMGSVENMIGSTMAKVGGFNIGAGFELPISTNGFIGGDLTTRKLNPRGNNDGGYPSSDYVDSISATTITIRLGFRF